MGAALLKYQSSPLYYQCDLEVFTETLVDGKTALSAKANPAPGHFAVLPLQEKLIQGAAYVFRIRFKAKTASDILNFQLVHAHTGSAEVIDTYNVPAGDAGGQWTERESVFTANAEDYSALGVEAAHLSGKGNYLIIDSVEISEAGETRRGLTEKFAEEQRKLAESFAAEQRGLAEKFAEEQRKLAENLTAEIKKLSAQNADLVKRLDNLTKRTEQLFNIHQSKTDLYFWHLARRDGESTLDLQKRFFRAMECTEPKLQVMQKATMILLKEFGRICAENGIDYWLDFGTLLGAVRHGGFVPWDDDIDVGMMRKDIPRLREAVEKSNTFVDLHQYYVINESTNCNIVRIVFKDTDIKVFVDIFIYDFCDAERKADTWNLHKSLRSQFNRDTLRYAVKPLNNPRNNYWENRRVSNPEDIAKIDEIRENLSRQLNVRSTESRSIIWGIDNVSTPVMLVEDSSDFFPLREVCFCDHIYKAPNLSEQHLQIRYGDIYALPNDILTHRHIARSDSVLSQCEKAIRLYGA